MVVLFKNSTIANEWMKEIGCTPDGVFLWLGSPVTPGASDFIEQVGDPDADTNVIEFVPGTDGRCAVIHLFSAADKAFFEEYCAEAITAGDVQVLDALPADWSPVS